MASRPQSTTGWSGPGARIAQALCEGYRTAIDHMRGPDCPPLARPFTTALSGVDFAKLLMDGWVPAGIALGISAAGLHDTLVTTSSGPWSPAASSCP